MDGVLLLKLRGHRNCDLSFVGELQCVTCQVKEDLAYAPGVPDDRGGNVRGYHQNELQPLLLAPHGHQVANFLQQQPKVELGLFDLQLARLDLAEIQYVVDKCKQRVSACSDGLGELLLFRCKLRFHEQTGHPDNPVKGGSYLMAHVGQELALGPAGLPGGFRGSLRKGKGFLKLFVGRLYLLPGAVPLPLYEDVVYGIGHIVGHFLEKGYLVGFGTQFYGKLGGDDPVYPAFGVQCSREGPGIRLKPQQRALAALVANVIDGNYLKLFHGQLRAVAQPVGLKICVKSGTGLVRDAGGNGVVEESFFMVKERYPCGAVSPGGDKGVADPLHHGVKVLLLGYQMVHLADCHKSAGEMLRFAAHLLQFRKVGEGAEEAGYVTVLVAVGNGVGQGWEDVTVKGFEVRPEHGVAGFAGLCEYLLEAFPVYLWNMIEDGYPDEFVPPGITQLLRKECVGPGEPALGVDLTDAFLNRIEDLLVVGFPALKGSPGGNEFCDIQHITLQSNDFPRWVEKSSSIRHAVDLRAVLPFQEAGAACYRAVISKRFKELTAHFLRREEISGEPEPLHLVYAGITEHPYCGEVNLCDGSLFVHPVVSLRHGIENPAEILFVHDTAIPWRDIRECNFSRTM